MDKRLSDLTLRHLGAMALGLLGLYGCFMAGLVLRYGPIWPDGLLLLALSIVAWWGTIRLWPRDKGAS